MELHTLATITILSTLATTTSTTISSPAQPVHPTVQRLCSAHDDPVPCEDLMRNTMQPELLKALTDIISDLDNCINKTIEAETALIRLMYTGPNPPPRDTPAFHTSNACVQSHVKALAEFMGAVQELQLGSLTDLEARVKSGLKHHQNCDLTPMVPLLDAMSPSLKDTPRQIKTWVDNVMVVHEQSKKILNAFRDKLPTKAA